MELRDECALSYYEDLAPLKSGSALRLLRHRESGQLYVKKRVSAANLPVYTELLAHPVPNMPRLALVIPDDGELIVVEEYLPGQTLQELLEQEGVLSEERVLDLGVQLVRIVAALHAARPPILHRDIKPSNILVTGDGVLKLLDLDAARVVRPGDGERSRDTRLLGTVGYAAPEQYGFQTSSPQTDLYSVGVVLNVMLTGCLPGERLAEGRLRSVISCCTRLDPAERYANAKALLAALRALQRGKAAPLPEDWRRFLPPGLRGKERFGKLCAAVGYFLLFGLGLTLEVEGVNAAGVWLNRVFFLGMALSVVLLTGNYLDIQSSLPLTRSRRLPVRIFGVLVYDTLLVLLLLFALALLCDALNLFV